MKYSTLKRIVGFLVGLGVGSFIVMSPSYTKIVHVEMANSIGSSHSWYVFIISMCLGIMLFSLNSMIRTISNVTTFLLLGAMLVINLEFALANGYWTTIVMLAYIICSAVIVAIVAKINQLERD